ncbi:carboxypeptidase regulatory-like domain-containing protein [Cryptosporangium minutisporangium]|uniref:carboxypeptidase regulatory-like domain-containing protein n=1 Tax=Cryptosporangium minutisporangium TaxID=113569 RepID=UPI0031EBC1CC
MTAGEPADLRLEVRQGNLTTQSGGQPATLVFAVTNDGPSKADAFNANVVIPYGDRGVILASSSPACNQVSGPTVLACPVNELEVGKTAVFTLVISPPPAGSIDPSEQLPPAAGQIAIDAGGDDPNGANDSSQFTLTLTAAPPPVTVVSGTIVNGSTGQPITGVSVVARDVNGATCPSTTDAAGAFNCTSQPLAGGQITIEATMAGYKFSRTTVTPQNGTITNVQLALDPAVASASPTPSAAPTSPAASASPAPQALKSDDGGFPWDTVLVVIGIVLALGGLGALGWWLYKRKDTDSGGPGGGGRDLPDLVGAESIMPTMPMRVPNSVLSETTVANQPPFGQPERVGAAAGADATAVWGAPAPTGSWQPGGWSPANDAQANVNRSTEPIQVSGGPSGWSGGSGQSSSSGERTAEWPTVDPGSADDAPASGVPAQVSERPVAPSDPTTAWPAVGDAGWAAAPHTRAAGPLSDQYASALPAEAPGVPSGPPAPTPGFEQSWGTPGRPAYGNPPLADAPLVGWDTPPAASPQPTPMSAPPMASQPMSAPPMASQPMSAPPMPMSAPPASPMASHAAGGYAAGGYPAAHSPVPPPQPSVMQPTAQWTAPPSFPTSASPTAMYPASAPPAAGYPAPGPPAAGYPASAPPAMNYPSSAPPAANYPASAPPLPPVPYGGYPPASPPASAPPAAGYPQSAPPWQADAQGWPSGPPANHAAPGAPQWPQTPAPAAGYPAYPPQAYPSATPPHSGPPAPPGAYGNYPQAAPPQPQPGQAPPAPEQGEPEWSAQQYWPPAGQR